jgi:hypothetical protein
MSRNLTTISCSPEIRDKIRARKSGGEPYDAVLERLLSEVDGE